MGDSRVIVPMRWARHGGWWSGRGRLWRIGAALAFLAGYLTGYLAFPPQPRPQAWDYLIVGGTVIDGTGRPGEGADVGMAGGRIVWVGRWRDRWKKSIRVKRVVDATGRVVAPGFIDVHTHVEGDIPATGPFRAPNFVGQGVTTVVTGNCGTSVVDVEGLFRRLDTSPKPLPRPNTSSMIV